MELIKVKPSRIEKISKCYQCQGKKVKHYDIPTKVNTVRTKADKCHYIIEENGVQYYSYEFNAMVEELGYILTDIENIKIEGKQLTFSTKYGIYKVGSLFELSTFKN